ncbi:MAG: D-glycero-beta-D-manno-heptose 1,7-bisphosphate 7-phosphatase [Halioglobus sp.]
MALLILDRDGVINQDSDDYIRCLDEWKPIAGSIEAIAGLSKAGYRVAIATNQSGLSRGYFGLDDLETIHDQLCKLVEEQGGSIAGIFYCPHLPDEGCECRKPATGLLRAIETELGESVAGSYFIGDSLKDLQAGQAMGCTPMLVLTGKGEKTQAQLESSESALKDAGAVAIYADLAAASRDILS